jgi:hypothetical protein
VLPVGAETSAGIHTISECMLGDLAADLLLISSAYPPGADL